MTDGTTATATQREKLLALEAERKQQQILLRQRLVKAYVNDEQIDFEDLQQSGLTVEYLDEQKLAIDRRRDLRRKMDTISENDAEMARLKIVIADKVRERDDEYNRANDAIRADEAALAAARAAYTAGKEARAELIKTCRHPEALGKIEALERRCADRAREHQNLSEQIKNTKHAYDDCQNRLTTGPDAVIAARAIRLETDLQTLDKRRLELDQLFEDQKVERKAIEDEWCCNPELI